MHHNVKVLWTFRVAADFVIDRQFFDPHLQILAHQKHLIVSINKIIIMHKLITIKHAAKEAQMTAVSGSSVKTNSH